MRRWVAAGAAGLVVLAGLAYAAFGWWLPADHRETLGAGPVEGTILVGPVSGSHEQTGPCDGVGDSPLVRLEKPLAATSVALCAPDGGGTRRLDEELLVDELISAYAEPDVERVRGGSCPAMLAMPHAVVLTLQTGERVRLAVPVDPCGFPRLRAERAAGRVWTAA